MSRPGRSGIFAIAVALAAFATPAMAAPVWTLDRVVLVMRHGVRPPTKAQPLPRDIVPAPWPTWDVNWGELTHHGERAVALLGAFDRTRYATLLGSGCPAIRAVADTDQRTVRTAEVYVAALLPGCTVPVEHKAANEVDARFSPFEAGSLLPDSALLAAADSALPNGSPAQLDRDLAADWASADHILDCRVAACIAAHPTSVSVVAGRVKLEGALALGASFAETLALEYADGQPPSQVGWGRASRAQITRLLALHAWEFAVTARPPTIARAAGAPLLEDIAAALSAPDKPAFAVFVGHDTNLALLGGALGLHWHARQFAADDPPPGGALVFERWSNGAGRYRLVLRFRSQSLDEMRGLSPVGSDAVQSLSFDRCNGESGCDTNGLHAALVRVRPGVPATPGVKPGSGRGAVGNERALP